MSTSAARSGVVFTYGEALGFADLEQLPKGMLGYGTQTANSGSIGGSETDIISVGSVSIGDSRLVVVEAILQLSNSDGGSLATLHLYQGSTELVHEQYQLSVVATKAMGCPIRALALVGAGSFSFKVTVNRSYGSGDVVAEAGSLYPGLLTIEDKGPAF